ncbi:MAG: hypothetical protein ACODAJ_15260 [Planctomycetota bacterium]
MDKFTLRSGVEIELVETTGVEEDLLTNRRLMKKGEGINPVCVRDAQAGRSWSTARSA